MATRKNIDIQITGHGGASAAADANKFTQAVAAARAELEKLDRVRATGGADNKGLFSGQTFHVASQLAGGDLKGTLGLIQTANDPKAYAAAQQKLADAQKAQADAQAATGHRTQMQQGIDMAAIGRRNDAYQMQRAQEMDAIRRRSEQYARSERTAEEQRGAGMAAVMRRNQAYEREQRTNEERKAADMAAIGRRTEQYAAQQRRSEEQQGASMAAVMRRNDAYQMQRAQQMAAIGKRNEDYAKSQRFAEEQKGAGMAAILRRNQQYEDAQRRGEDRRAADMAAIQRRNDAYVKQQQAEELRKAADMAAIGKRNDAYAKQLAAEESKRQATMRSRSVYNAPDMLQQMRDERDRGFTPSQAAANLGLIGQDARNAAAQLNVFNRTQRQTAQDSVLTSAAFRGCGVSLQQLQAHMSATGATMSQTISHFRLTGAAAAGAAAALRQAWTADAQAAALARQAANDRRQAIRDLEYKGSMIGSQMQASGGRVLGGLFDTAKEFGKMEMGEMGLATMLGGAEKAADKIKALKDLAAHSPILDISDAISHAQKMLGQGTPEGDLIPTLKTLGDMTFALGGNNATLERVVRNFNQIRNASRMTARDFYEFATAGLPVKEVLQRMGISLEEARKGMTEIDADKFLNTMLEMGRTDPRFADRMAKATNTLSGSLKQLEDEATLAKVALGQELAPSVVWATQKLRGFLEWFQELDPATKKIIAFSAAGVGALGFFGGKILTLTASAFFLTQTLGGASVLLRGAGAASAAAGAGAATGAIGFGALALAAGKALIVIGALAGTYALLKRNYDAWTETQALNAKMNETEVQPGDPGWNDSVRRMREIKARVREVNQDPKSGTLEKIRILEWARDELKAARRLDESIEMSQKRDKLAHTPAGRMVLQRDSLERQQRGEMSRGAVRFAEYIRQNPSAPVSQESVSPDVAVNSGSPQMVVPPPQITTNSDGSHTFQFAPFTIPANSTVRDIDQAVRAGA